MWAVGRLTDLGDVMLCQKNLHESCRMGSLGSPFAYLPTFAFKSWVVWCCVVGCRRFEEWIFLLVENEGNRILR